MRSPLTKEAWCLLLEPKGRPGAENMAVDAELLEHADRTGAAVLRLYCFDPPCLSLGRNQRPDRYDHEAIVRLGLDVVRRPTGGRAVWHEHEVTYAVAAQIEPFGGLRRAYHAIHARLARALRSLGVDATLALHHPPPSSTVLHQPASCFATPARGEILVAGRKLVGSAQVRKRHAFLQQGSILLDGSQDIVRLVSGEGGGVGSRETTLTAILGRPIQFEEVAEAIAAAWDAGVTSTNLHQPPQPPPICVSDLALLAAAVKS